MKQFVIVGGKFYKTDEIKFLSANVGQNVTTPVRYYVTKLPVCYTHN